ncbi:unnamed protein product [Amaranthus hypochondriacus]
MAAFQQYPASFLVDSVFLPNVSAIKTPEAFHDFYSSSQNSQHPLILHNQKGSSVDASSCLEQLSFNERSSMEDKQRNESLSMADKADSSEQVTQKCCSLDKKRKTRKGSSSTSANSKEVKQVKNKKQKEDKTVTKDDENEKKTTPKEEPPKGYIHVRARRGQATDSHSLAERVRREKISERMKMLQAIVPGCDKVTGKALMLDEIINYVQSLQNQVEFLSMKLASLDPMLYNFGLMDHDPMLFGTPQVINNVMALPIALTQPNNGGSSIDPPQSFANTTAMSCSTASSATTSTFPGSIVDSSANLGVFDQQEQKPCLLPLQDAGSLYWGLNEQQRQNIINQFGSNLYSLH